MKIIKLIAFTLAMMLSVNGSALAESALNKILSTGVLKAGTTGDFPPFSKRDTATNEYEGFDIDVLKELAKDMDVEIEFVPTDWKTLVNGIVAGNYDISGSASIQAKRMKAAGYSDTYMAVVIKAFTTEDKISRFNGWDSINKSDVKTATTLGTTFETLSKNWFPNSDLTLIEAPARGYQEVLAGRSDVFITSNVEGSTLLSKYPNIREIQAEPRNPTPLAMLLPQGDQVWINFVDHWVKLKKARGFFDELAKKHGL